MVSPTIQEVDESSTKEVVISPMHEKRSTEEKKPVYSLHKREDLFKSYNIKDKPQKNFESIKY